MPRHGTALIRGDRHNRQRREQHFWRKLVVVVIGGGAGSRCMGKKSPLYAPPPSCCTDTEKAGALLKQEVGPDPVLLHLQAQHSSLSLVSLPQGGAMRERGQDRTGEACLSACRQSGLALMLKKESSPSPSLPPSHPHRWGRKEGSLSLFMCCCRPSLPRPDVGMDSPQTAALRGRGEGWEGGGRGRVAGEECEARRDIRGAADD